MVLVRPAGGANVGAVCRAIKNMGGGPLTIVGGSFDVEEARRMAVHAGDVLAERRQVGGLREALAGCGTVVGTTARRGAYRSRARDVREIAAMLARRTGEDAHARPALVFGCERSGLSNRDLAACHHLAYVPMATLQPSLNLAQAVLICLYEVYRARAAAADGKTAGVGAGPVSGERVTASALEDTFDALQEALIEIGFLPAENPAHLMFSLRAMLGRTEMSSRELRIMRGIARQIRWYARGGCEVAIEKRARGERLR